MLIRLVLVLGILGGCWGLTYARQEPSVYSLDRRVAVVESRLDAIERLGFGILMVVLSQLTISVLQLRRPPKGSE